MNERTSLTDSSGSQWNGIFLFGAISAIIVLAGTILDIIFGSVTGGNLSALPQSAADRFMQFQHDPLIALYNLDLLNVIIQIIMIPAYVALFAAHRKVEHGFALLALIIFLTGTTLFVAGNVALPMYELSVKYAAATLESQRMLYAAAGEAMLAKGIHGSLGVFIGFILPNLAGIIMSWVMLKGRIFSRVTGWLGLSGSILISVYLVLVTFVPGVQSMATLFAAPGGLMLMAWIVMFTVKLFKLGSNSGQYWYQNFHNSPDVK